MSEVILWLLDGDVSIQYQTQRYLLGNDDTELRNRISAKGWGRQYLEARNKRGHWGHDYYQPKWISTHYTMLDLKHLNIDPHHPDIKKIVDEVLENEKGPDGGILPIGTVKNVMSASMVWHSIFYPILMQRKRVFSQSLILCSLKRCQMAGLIVNPMEKVRCTARCTLLYPY